MLHVARIGRVHAADMLAGMSWRDEVTPERLQPASQPLSPCPHSHRQAQALLQASRLLAVHRL